MGTTLQNGVYLPNEGERNCYAGLKTNWEILDQKVADVTALQQAVAGALHREIVESLPTTDIDPNTIYMILSGTSATENVYNEFMYVNNAWELIGTSATDLTNYYTKGEVDSKLLLKANASDLTSHTGDTTIHVTTADKNRWNNQTYVFRYSSTALVASSTNSNSLLDNTDNLKVGDKVIDSSGVLFSVTAIDTANSTFTIGTALIDLAQDSDVVHKSGNETISGQKTFTDSQNFTGYTAIRIYSRSDEVGVLPSTSQTREIRFTDKNNALISYFSFQHRTSSAEPFRTCWRQQKVDGTSSYYSVNFNNLGEFYPENSGIKLGTSTNRWAEVYATNYYYGSNNVEFSTKFVTSDTNQTIHGAKTFSESVFIYNSDTTATTPQITFKNSKVTKGGSGTGNQSIFFTDKDNKTLSRIFTNNPSNGTTSINFNVSTLDNYDADVSTEISLFVSKNGTKVLQPLVDNDVSLGRTSNKWKDACTYLINGLTPSSLSLPDIDNRIDISSYITDLTGVNNEYTPTVNGWISIRSSDATNISILDSATNIGNQSVSNTATYLTVMAPCIANKKVYINIVCTSLSHAYFIPCQGNV